mgnify:CR=1 FL=1
MALTDDNMNGTGMVMPVAPMMGNNQGGFGFGDGNGWWILLLFFLLCGNGGWGGGFGGGFDNGLYPWMNQSNQINGGFRDQMLNTSINGIQQSITSGFGDVQNALCGGFAGVNASINGAQNAIAQQMYTNQISDLERSFAAQTAMMQGFNGVQTGLADAKYVEATEACATRNASAQNTRDIIDSQTRGTQAILDKLCALELDGVKGQLAQAQRENLALQNQVNMAAMQASQAAQTAVFQQGLNDEVDALYNRLKNCPVGTTPVYGNQPIFTCGGNGGCGCGNNF